MREFHLRVTLNLLQISIFERMTGRAKHLLISQTSQSKHRTRLVVINTQWALLILLDHMWIQVGDLWVPGCVKNAKELHEVTKMQD